MPLDRHALILEIVSQKGSATVAEICAHSDLPKPSAYRLVQDLAAEGLLEPVARGRYGIGARLKRIAAGDLSDRSVIDRLSPAMARAAETHGAAFFLARLRGPAVEIVHVETPSSGVSFLHPGLGRRPLHACSCGKAVAAVSPGLDAVTRLKRYTDRTLTRPEEIRAELEAIRRRGYAECVEELERGMCSVATTLGESGPGTAISVGATGSARVFTPTFRSEIGAELVRMAGAFSAALFPVERAA